MFHHHPHHMQHGHPGHHGKAHHGPCLCVTRRFRSKAEKLELLKKYKDELEKELAGVEETLAEHDM